MILASEGEHLQQIIEHPIDIIDIFGVITIITYLFHASYLVLRYYFHDIIDTFQVC